MAGFHVVEVSKVQEKIDTFTDEVEAEVLELHTVRGLVKMATKLSTEVSKLWK